MEAGIQRGPIRSMVALSSDSSDVSDDEHEPNAPVSTALGGVPRKDQRSGQTPLPTTPRACLTTPASLAATADKLVAVAHEMLAAAVSPRLSGDAEQPGGVTVCQPGGSPNLHWSAGGNLERTGMLIRDIRAFTQPALNSSGHEMCEPEVFPCAPELGRPGQQQPTLQASAAEQQAAADARMQARVAIFSGGLAHPARGHGPAHTLLLGPVGDTPGNHPREHVSRVQTSTEAAELATASVSTKRSTVLASQQVKPERLLEPEPEPGHAPEPEPKSATEPEPKPEPESSRSHLRAMLSSSSSDDASSGSDDGSWHGSNSGQGVPRDIFPVGLSSLKKSTHIPPPLPSSLSLSREPPPLPSSLSLSPISSTATEHRTLVAGTAKVSATISAAESDAIRSQSHVKTHVEKHNSSARNTTSKVIDPALFLEKALYLGSSKQRAASANERLQELLESVEQPLGTASLGNQKKVSEMIANRVEAHSETLVHERARSAERERNAQQTEQQLWRLLSLPSPMLDRASD